MYFLHGTNSDRQTRLLNVLGQIAMMLGDKKNYKERHEDFCFISVVIRLYSKLHLTCCVSEDCLPLLVWRCSDFGLVRLSLM